MSKYLSLSVVLLVLAFSQSCWGYDPDGPEVQAIVGPARNYLLNYSESPWDHEALIGLALYKADVKPDHPRLQKSLKIVVEEINKGLTPTNASNIYGMSIAVMLLSEVDAKLYEPQIKKCLEVIMTRKRATGAYAYSHAPEIGDVSQTQYAALAFWFAQKHKIQVAPAEGKSVIEYLIRGQSQSGGWSYQTPIHSDNMVTLSMTAAGAGTLYMMANWLGYSADIGNTERRPEEKGMPPSVEFVEMIDAKTGKAKKKQEKLIELNEAGLRAAMQRADANLRNFQIFSPQHQYYYLYGYERYASFRDAAMGVNSLEPAWYNQGVDFLKANQESDGSFKAESTELNEGRDVIVAFALLFLVRGTRKSLAGAEYESATLRAGGAGLRDEVKLIMKGGKLEALPVEMETEGLLAVLQENDPEALSQLDSIESLKLNDLDEAAKAKQVAQLRVLVNHPDYNVRKLAVMSMATHQNIENVPYLIYALTDPDLDIVVRANNALKKISRKIKGFDLSEKPSKGEIDGVRQSWIQWYIGMCPDGKLFQPE